MCVLLYCAAFEISVSKLAVTSRETLKNVPLLTVEVLGPFAYEVVPQQLRNYRTTATAGATASITITPSPTKTPSSELDVKASK